MDDMNVEFAPTSELDSMFENVGTETAPSDSMKMSGKNSNVVLAVENKGEHLKESIIVSEDEEKKEREIGEVSNEENTKEEMEKEGDAKSEAKDEETLEVDSRKNVSKLRKKPKRLKKKNIVLRQKAKGALISMSKLDKDSVFGNVDTEIVPPELVNLNDKESSISVSVSDKNDMTDVVGLDMATADKNDTIEKIDVRLATSKPAKMNGKESDVEDKDDHLKESIMITGDEEKKECGMDEASNQENTIEEVKNEKKTTNEAKNEKQLEANFKKKVNRLRKRGKKKMAALRGTNEVPAKHTDNPESANKDVRLATSKPAKMNGEESVLEDKDEHLKESIMVSGDEEKKECGISEVKNEEKTKNEAKNEEQLEANFKKKVNRLRKRGKKKAAGLRGTNEVASKHTDNPESSNKKSKMMAKGTGMIFMCNSKTKKDCYHYKVLGLPASKRDAVLKICEGMKLFLFDIDSKLMFGIYKAAGPGGYNIEPKAFKSAFPSQVRFTVQEDCAPLPEKEFKKIIKDNYYSKNKFHSELTSEQVKDLCKLFRVSIKSSESKRLHRTPLSEAPRYVDRESKRLPRSRKAETHTFMDPKPKRLRRSPRAETQTFRYRDSARHQHWEEERHPAPPRDYLYREEPVIYRREVYASPEALRPPWRPLPLPSAAVLPPLDTDIHRRDRLDTDFYRRNQRQYPDPQLLDGQLRPRNELLDGELRPRNEFVQHDPYLTSREHSLHHDPLFSSSRPLEYRSRRPSDEYHSSPGLRPEYGAPRPLYRYYS
ncbi:hypothetical protein ACOSP7_024875 [Xanthoceras sorbifolium]